MRIQSLFQPGLPHGVIISIGYLGPPVHGSWIIHSEGLPIFSFSAFWRLILEPGPPCPFQPCHVPRVRNTCTRLFCFFLFFTPLLGSPSLFLLGPPLLYFLTLLCAFSSVPGSWIMYVLSPPMFCHGKPAISFFCVSVCSCIHSANQNRRARPLNPSVPRRQGTSASFSF